MLGYCLWTACVTPFCDDGDNIDYESLEKCLRVQADSGNGIVLFGSTGEGLSLSYREKCEIIEFCCNLGLGDRIIVGVPGVNLCAALEWLDFCDDYPLAGYLMTTPVYTKPGAIGQRMWFERLLDKAGRPCMLYNIPGRAGVKLHTDAVFALKDHPSFVAIKDSGGSVESVIEYRSVAPDIAVFCGDDVMIASMAAEGAAGLVSVASNVWPVATGRYAERVLRGERIDSRNWWRACKTLFCATNPIPVKILMHNLGMISSCAVRLPLSTADFTAHRALSECDGIINGEYSFAD